MGYLDAVNKLLLPLLPFLLLSCAGDAQVPRGPGATQYENLQCRTCHGTDGSGSILGPGIADKGEFWNTEDLDRYLTDPKAYAEGHTRLGTRTMPAVPSDMTREDKDALLAHTLGLMGQ